MNPNPGGLPVSTTFRKVAVTVTAFASLALGGAALAGAADKTSSGTPSPSNRGMHQQAQLSAATAAKVKAAALAKVPGATVERTEAGGPYGTPYHAHIKTSDGTEKVVLVNASFQATDVVAPAAPGGRGGRHGGGPHGNETPLTGTTKEQVEAAVKAKYAGATIVRTETNGDSTAPYESHIMTSDGKELEVLVSKDFKVVDARQRPAHP